MTRKGGAERCVAFFQLNEELAISRREPSSPCLNREETDFPMRSMARARAVGLDVVGIQCLNGDAIGHCGEQALQQGIDGPGGPSPRANTLQPSLLRGKHSPFCTGTCKDCTSRRNLAYIPSLTYS